MKSGKLTTSTKSTVSNKPVNFGKFKIRAQADIDEETRAISRRYQIMHEDRRNVNPLSAGKRYAELNNIMSKAEEEELVENLTKELTNDMQTDPPQVKEKLDPRRMSEATLDTLNGFRNKTKKQLEEAIVISEDMQTRVKDLRAVHEIADTAVKALSKERSKGRTTESKTDTKK